MRRVGIIYNFRQDAAREVAHGLYKKLAGAWDTWICPTNRDAQAQTMAAETDVIITVGGDGTILRAFRTIFPLTIPILGVNTGRVGFMTEIDGSEAIWKVPEFLTSNPRVEERSVLKIELIRADDPEGASAEFPAFNDVVVGRGMVARVAYIEARVDGQFLTRYRADAVIISTATGSTGYAFACGGPVMYPESRELLLVPVSPHLSLPNPVVIPADGVVELSLLSDHRGLASADGQVDHPLGTGDIVRVRRDERTARFLRAGPPSRFYGSLATRLQIKSA